MSDTSQSLGRRDVSPAHLVDLARYPTTGTDAPDFARQTHHAAAQPDPSP